jgi:putative colanic acid biosynthesis acetyltransferase WcaF
MTDKLKTDLASFDNSWYKPGGSLLKRIVWYFINASFLNSFFPISGVKVFLLRSFGASIGKGVVIKPHVSVKYPWHLRVGNNVWIGEYTWIDNLTTVDIQDNVCISQGALLLCGNHHYKKPSFDLIVGKITLEEGSWVGAKAVVCPGVTLKSHSMLTVGSVATRSLEAYSINQGNPAVKIKDRVLKI